MAINHPRCTAYCDGTLHAIECISHPEDTEENIRRMYERHHPRNDVEIVHVRRAYEADAAAWHALLQRFGPTDPAHTACWLIFAREKECTDAPSS